MLKEPSTVANLKNRNHPRGKTHRYTQSEGWGEKFLKKGSYFLVPGSSEAYFFSTTSIPTVATVIMTAIAVPDIVIVFPADYLL